MKDARGRRSRWLTEMEEYDYDIRYIVGKSNMVADSLSRSFSCINITDLNDFKKKQQEDKHISEILSYLHPMNNEKSVSNSNPLASRKKFLKIKDNILYHESRRGDLFVVPESLQTIIIQ